MIIDVALSPAEIARLPETDLRETTCVVFDVLRATSSMITALASGAREIWPVCTIEEARRMKGLRPEAVLGGERQGERIEGFAIGNSPFEYRELAGQTIISTTTNGTVALRACDRAQCVLVGAVLNLGAIAAELRGRAPERVMLVCAGTFETFALEDAWAAGRLVELLENGDGGAYGRETSRLPHGSHLTDAAIAALAVARLHPQPLEALRASRNGRALIANGRLGEVEWCAQESLFPAIGVMEGGVVRAGLSPTPNPANLPAHAR